MPDRTKQAPTGWELTGFDRLFTQPPRATLKSVPKSQYKQSGQYPVVDQGKARLAGYTDDEQVVYRGKLPVIVFGDHTRELKLLSEPFAPGADGTQILCPVSPELDCKFLYYLLCATPLKNLGYARHFKLLKEASFAVPRNRREQERIAECLSSVDDTIEKTLAIIDQLEIIKRGLRRELLTRGMPGRHKNFKETEVGRIPSGWKCVRAADVCALITKGTTPAAHEMQVGAGEIPFLKVYNIDPSGLVDFTEKPTYVAKATHNKFLARSKVFPGDVVMNIVGPPLGKVAIIPGDSPEWNINQAIAAFRPNQAVDGRFLYECLRAEHLFAWALSRAKRTSTQLNLTLEICRDVPIPLPSIDEQHEISEVLASASSAISTNLRMLRGLRESKSALSDALLSGQLRVSAQQEAA